VKGSREHRELTLVIETVHVVALTESIGKPLAFL